MVNCREILKTELLVWSVFKILLACIMHEIRAAKFFVNSTRIAPHVDNKCMHIDDSPFMRLCASSALVLAPPRSLLTFTPSVEASMATPMPNFICISVAPCDVVVVW